MADDKNPQVSADPEVTQAEKHVAEIMGPAQGFDGQETEVPSAPLPPKASSASKNVAAPENEAELAVAGTSDMPDEDIAAVNAKLTAQVHDGPYENDLDMEKLPTDFKATTQDDQQTDAAVDDIMQKDAEAVLPGGQAHEKAVIMKPSLFDRLKNAWFFWWDNKWSRYGTIIFAVLLALGVIFVKPVRNLFLNTAGIRASVIVNVLDGATNLPLQNAVVSVDGVSGETNNNGEVRLTGIHLGSHEVSISKIAFAAVKKQVDFGMRIVDLGEVTLKPTGQKLTFEFADYLSGKSVADVQVASGKATAKSNKDGKAILTIAPGSDEDITVAKEGIRTDKVSLQEAQAGTVKRKLVPAAPAIFISKESGKYDVYKMYVDGKDKEVLLAGTGLETQSIVVLPKPDGQKVAVVSSRDDKRNKDGYLLTGLFVVDTETGDQVNIEYSEQVTLLGWRGDTLLYSQVVAGASAANPNRQKIIAYDFAANKRFQLASANYFAGAELIGNTLYYTVSATDPNAKESFARVNIDGTAKKTLYTGDTWGLLRSDYTKLKFQTPNKWYEYTLGASAPVESTPPSEYGSKYFVDNPDGKTSAWVDIRDNKGVLLVRNLADGKDKELTTQKNMQLPSYWLNTSVIVYRVAGASEVAEYAVSVDSGAPRKIADVSLTGVR